jgi:signal transduction histidine kinase
MNTLDPTLVFLACLAVFLAMVGSIFALLVNQARVLRERADRNRLLLAQHRRLRRMIDHLPVGALYLGSGELLMNPKLMEMLGGWVGPVQNEAQLLEALLGQRALKAARILARERRRESPRSLEVAYGPGHGKILRATPFRGEGEEVWTLQDITRERRTFQQLLRAQKLESIGTMVSGVSHEFGNLLMAINGCAGALKRRTGDDTTAQQAVDLILDATETGHGIIRQLLSFARTEVGSWSRIDAGALAERVLRLVRPLLGKSFHLELIQPDTPLVIQGDASQIQQALLNLILNAKDAQPEGGPIRVSVYAAAGGGRHADRTSVAIEVADRGCGIPIDHQERIFEPFFTTKGPAHGGGLGLSVTHGILEAHGGAIHCESRPGEGTRMTLLLPIPGDPTHSP